MIDKHIPGILAHSSEFATLKVRSKDELKVLTRIKQEDKVKEAIPKPNEKRGTAVQVKPICLLMGYMYDILEKEDTDIESISADLEVILRSIPSYIDIMLSQTMALS